MGVLIAHDHLLPHDDRELRLLLPCARATVDAAAACRIRELAGSGLHWTRLLALAGRHGLAPLVHRHLGGTAADLVPAATLGSLRAYTRENGAVAFDRTGELLRMLAAFEDGGIEGMPIAGPALAARLYGDVGARRVDELDLLVRSRDVWRASAILQGRGFAPDSDVSVARREACLRGDYVRLFRSADTRTVVALRWGISPRSFAIQFDEAAVWRRNGRLLLHGRAVATPSDEDLLLMLCILGARHAWHELEHAAGVAELMRSSPALDWTYVWRKAGEMHCRRILTLGLCLACGLFDAGWPADVPAPGRAGAVARLARAIVRRWRAIDPEPPAFARQAAFDLRLKDCVADRARSCARVLLAPAANDWTRVPPRGPWSLAGPLVRAVRNARRHRFIDREAARGTR